MGFQGREHQWDVEIDGVGYLVVRENGTPVWSVNRVPQVQGKNPNIIDEEREWRSWHGGFGYSHYLVPDAYYYASGIDTRWPRTLIMGPLVTTLSAAPAGNAVGFFEENSALYVLASRYVQKIDTTNDDVETADGAGNGIDLGSGNVARAAIAFDGSTIVTYVNSSGTEQNVYVFDGTTWDNTGHNVIASYLAKYWSDTYYALATTFVNSGDPDVRWVPEGTDPGLAAGYTSGYTIGDDTTAVTGMTAVDATLFVAKTDGLYTLDKTGQARNVLPVYTINANNGKNVVADSSGYVWYPCVEGYYRYDMESGRPLDCTPGMGLANASPLYGRVTVGVQWKGWRYVAVYNGTDSYILCGRPRGESDPGIGPYVWHGALHRVASAEVTCMHITSLTSPARLYFGAGSNVYYFRLPSNGENPLADSNYRYAASGSLYLPADEWGVSGLTWRLTGLEIENEGLGGATYVDVYAQLDDGDWQSIARADVAGGARLSVPASSDWRFRRCALRLDFVNSTSTSTPKMRAVVARAVRRARTRDLIETTLYCSDRVLSRMGLENTGYSGLDLVNHIRNQEGREPVVLRDWWTGSPRERTVLVGPSQEILVKHVERGDASADQAVHVAMRELDRTSTAARYGTGRYGQAQLS